MAVVQIFFCLLCLAEAHLIGGQLSISITRHHKGDAFIAKGGTCYKDMCVGLTSGTAAPTGNNECECQCAPNLPVFRDDINTCVEDIQECTLVPFVTGAAVKKIPFVFLPLKGQIVYPSAEIVVSDLIAPVCVVSGGKFLGRAGWMNLRNNSGVEPPFRLFRDEGRTYLQWLGETSLRMAMEGRIILVHLMCKDANAADEPKIHTPCIAFRVAGNPSIREVAFATDIQLAEEHSGGLSVREYIAIGVCSLLLAVVYVASVFLYFHIKKRKKKKASKKNGEDAQLTLGEEGVIKSNPLLQASRHLVGGGQDNAGYMSDSNSCCSDAEQSSDLLCLNDDDLLVHQNMQTSAIIHPCELDYGETILNQDPNSIEKLPEENVSIVETLEMKEEHPEMIKGMSAANVRRKLYFNPSYFEPDLLKAPPPAALEFLIKIREVIAIAKHKMSAKKFSPSLLGIPEEDGNSKADCNSLRAQKILPAETPETCDARKSFSSPVIDAEPAKFHQIATEFCCPSDAKQRIIRKWLEDVPIMVTKTDECRSRSSDAHEVVEIGKSSMRSRQMESCKSESPVVSKEETKSAPVPPVRQEKKRPSTKTRPPPLPPKQMSPEGNSISSTPDDNESKTIENFQNKTEFPVFSFSPLKISGSSTLLKNENPGRQEKGKGKTPPSPPPLPTIIFGQNAEEVPRVQGKDRVSPTIAKNLMDAVIQELSGYKKNDKTLKRKEEPEEKKVPNENPQGIKTQNLKDMSPGTVMEETQRMTSIKGLKEYLPIDELGNEVVRPKNSSNTTVQRKELDTPDDHEYEIIFNPDVKPANEEKSKDLKIYNLPEILSKNDRNEGYSLVSEVYVNDGYSCCSSGESPPSSYTNSSLESEKIQYDTLEQHPGRLTIHVQGSTDHYKHLKAESDNFEPDTLDRKPRRSKLMKKLIGTDAESERYSNQRFHDMACNKNSNQSNQNETFTDSLERPSIMLKSNGSFKRNSLESDLNDFFRNLDWTRADNFGSLREIFEAKSKQHKRRTETTSLIGSVNSDTDCISTLSWSEEKRNKLLHHGIVLHIDEKGSRRHKKHCRVQMVKSNQTKPPARPPKPCPSPRSGSDSPPFPSPCTSPSVKKSGRKLRGESPVPFPSPRSLSPPVPPPRSVPVSPPPLPQFQSRSTCSSPIAEQSRKISSPPLSPCNNSSFSVVSKGATSSNPSQVSSLPPSACPAPPRPPKESVGKSPPLPPRNSKPPLPPKHSKKHKPASSKFATRPLPPLPHPRPAKDPHSSPVSYKDLETLSVLSGASLDSLNSSEYEAFYTLPYEEEEEGNVGEQEFRVLRNKPSSNNTMLHPPSIPSFSFEVERRSANQFENQSKRNSRKKSWREFSKVNPHKPDDSGYLSTDSNDSYCPQMILSSQISRIAERAESLGGLNSETEESFGDGASESGAESIATDSFFYGNFQNKADKPTEVTDMYPYTLRLSDVEVNSDSERHCMPIMVRP